MRFNLADGKLLKVWAPKISFGGSSGLSPDGSQIVSARGTGPLSVYDVATQAIRRQILVAGAGSRSMQSVHFVGFRYAVVSQSREIERSKGMGAVVDLNTGKVTNLPARILSHSCMAFAETPKGELQLGWMDGEKLHFETLAGAVKELPLDEQDSPTKPNRRHYGYFVPTMLFDNAQVAFASLQYETALHGGEDRTGSVNAWN